MKYDPFQNPDPEDWLELDEQEAIALVSEYHEDEGIEIPSPMIHAVLHTIVENQIALKEQKVTETLERLGKEGLDRHEAIHAIGTVLLANIQDAIKGELDETNIVSDYEKRLDAITADKWLNM